MSLKTTLLAAAFALSSSTLAFAETNITWWHAMGGQLGETVNKIAEDFNASQSDYKITPVYKGSYEETLTAGIAAFRAGEQPNIIQVLTLVPQLLSAQKAQQFQFRTCFLQMVLISTSTTTLLAFATSTLIQMAR